MFKYILRTGRLCVAISISLFVVFGMEFKHRETGRTLGSKDTSQKARSRDGQTVDSTTHETLVMGTSFI
jgi:hypothetical protein